jgi:WD40 repeat protein
MPRPRPPSIIDTVTTPLFGICWYGNPGDGTSIVAYCGGGGSAATGVKNFMTIREAGEEPMEISTGDQIGVSLTIIQNPVTSKLHLLVAVGTKVERYSLPGGLKTGEIEVGDNLNCVAVNAMTDLLACGCENGTVKVYKISDDHLGDLPLHTYEGHSKAVSSVSFSLRDNFLISSAKDGTARVWKNGKAVGTLTCSIKDHKDKAPPPKREAQVLVRGCAFGDMNGKLIYTVASGRRGNAYLSKWEYTKDEKYECITRTKISACPISAMSLSSDAGLLALGAVDGTVILWGIERWKPLKSFREVHDLPVTCIAARPYPLPLKVDENGVHMHAISASADSQLAWLSLHFPPRKPRKPVSFKGILHSMVKLAVALCMLYPVANEVWEKCEDKWDNQGYAKTWECIRDDVLVAPVSRPGILIPPH